MRGGSFTLSPRQARLALDLLTGAVIVSIAVALAGLTWRIAGHAGIGAITVPSGRSAPAVGAGGPDVTAALALAPFGKPGAMDNAQPTTLPLELKGVFAASPADHSVAYISVSGAAATSFRIGDAVQSGTIQAILADRVLIANAGRTEFLAFPDPTLTPEQRAQAAQQQAQATQARPATPAAPGASGPAVPSAATIGTLLQRFDASPAEGGGYKIGDNAPPGLAPGDVLVAINGAPLSDPQAVGSAYAAAQSSGSAQITIQRNGQRVTMTVPLR